MNICYSTEMKFLSLLLVCSLIVHAVPIYAHGEGKSYEKQIGKYLLDVGYNPAEVVAGQPIYFDLRLYQKEPTPGAAEYSDVWVRISREETTLFASGLAPTTGQSGMVYTFDTPGTYTVSTRFEKGVDTLAETSFEIEVRRAADTSPVRLPYIGAALAVALAVFYAWYRIKYALVEIHQVQ